MYIPLWLIVVAVIAYLIYRSNQKKSVASTSGLFQSKESVGDYEESASRLKGRIFSLEHFDSPHFIDLQNAFDAMEVNYLRLKQRLSHQPEKVLEIAKDWQKYVEYLGDLKHARVMLDVDMSDNAFDNLSERSKEPSIAVDEIQKKFKSLLGDDFQSIPPDYFERMEKTEKPNKETRKAYGLANDWKYYYRDSGNLFTMEQNRKKRDEEWKAEKEAEAKK